MNVTIGVLSYQGSVAEHMNMLKKMPGVKAVEVKTPDALKAVDGLILPGGESTTIAKLLDVFGLYEPLRRRITEGMPVFGTCAGLILLAKEVENQQAYLAVMDMKVRRNAYGRQIDSFARSERIPEFSDRPVEMVFIRAPWIDSVYGTARVIKRLDGHIVAARQDNMLVTSFHPELTQDKSVHLYFAETVRCEKAKRTNR